MPFWIPAIAAVASGISSVISGQTEANQRNAQINAAEGILKSNLLSQKDLQDLLLSNKRYYTANLTSLLNTTALRTRGVKNAPVVGGAISSGIAGQEAQTAAGIKQDTLKYNADIRTRIASLETSRGNSNVLSDFFTGATSGLTAGMEISKYISSTSKKEGNTPPEGNPQAGDSGNPYIDYLGNDQMYLRNRTNPYSVFRNSFIP